MRQLVVSGTKPAQIVEVPSPTLDPRSVLVRTAYGAVSVGTERAGAQAGYSGLIEKVSANRDRLKSVVDMALANGIGATYTAVTEILERWRTSGYSCAGTIEDVGSEISDLRVGDRVACAGASAAHAELCVVPRNLVSRVPDNVSLEHAAFAAIGSIALHGVRQATPEPCSYFAVIGLGIVGQLTAQIAASSGVLVTAMDLDEDRVRLAQLCGSHEGVVIANGSEAQQVERITQNRGYDAVLVTAATQSSEVVRLASRIARDRGRVVIVGDVGLQLDREPMYMKELDLRFSRSYGPGRYDPKYENQGHDYPYGYVRWTEQRNLESFLSLVSRDEVRIGPLITHQLDIDQASAAFESLVNPSGKVPLGITLRYPETNPEAHRRVVTVVPAPARNTPTNKRPGIAVVGLGSFAKSVLLPALSGLEISKQVLVSSRGLSPVQIGLKYGFSLAATDLGAALSAASVDALFITTRHRSHAAIVVQALEAGKAVFVEKPLATSLEELATVCAVQRQTNGFVMVGFNRRFAPMVCELRSFFGEKHGPMALTIRVNAGAAANHWSATIEEGGRIVGEACHFVDLLAHLVGAPICRVSATSTRPRSEGLEETLCATFEFADGSVGSLNYNAVGNNSIGKEYIEVFCDGKVGIIDDFRQLTLATGKKILKTKKNPDKGHKEEVRRFIEWVEVGGSAPIPFDEAVAATLATLALLESSRTREVVQVETVNCQ